MWRQLYRFLLRHVAQCFHLLNIYYHTSASLEPVSSPSGLGVPGMHMRGPLWQENLLSLNQAISVLENLLSLNHAVYLKCCFLDSWLWGIVRNVGEVLIGRAYYIHDWSACVPHYTTHHYSSRYHIEMYRMYLNKTSYHYIHIFQFISKDFLYITLCFYSTLHLKINKYFWSCHKIFLNVTPTYLYTWYMSSKTRNKAIITDVTAQCLKYWSIWSVMGNISASMMSAVLLESFQLSQVLM